MANGHGGKRAGSGRKPQVVKDWQGRNLLILQSVLGEDSIRKIADTLRQHLEAGDPDAWRVGLGYLFGAVPKQVNVDITLRLRQMAEQMGLDPDEAVKEAQRIISAGIG